MIAVLINAGAVLAGSVIGMLCGKRIPEKLSKGIMGALGLCVIYMGIDGALAGKNTLVLIFSMAVGTLLGTLLNIDGALKRLGDWVNRRFHREGGPSLAEGFVTATLLFCVGSMTVVGSLEAGLGLEEGRNMLYLKSVLDGFSAILFASSMGIGVALSAVCVLIVQGGFCLFAGALAPLLTDAMTAEMVCAGSVMLIALGLNMLGVTKLKVANYLPALVLAPLFLVLYNCLAG